MKKKIANGIIYTFMGFIALALFIAVANIIGGAAVLAGHTEMHYTAAGSIVLGGAIVIAALLSWALHNSTK
jgi:hypothetical protein